MKNILQHAKNAMPEPLHPVLEKRAAAGQKKYGLTLDAHPMGREQALANELQEVLDAVQYAFKAGDTGRAAMYRALAEEILGELKNPALAAKPERGERWD